MDEWEIVRDAFGCEECNGCEFYNFEYFSDTGLEDWCSLGDIAEHNPRWCLAFDRIKEEMEDE